MRSEASALLLNQFFLTRTFLFRNFVSKLPDKGEKIKALRDKIEKVLEHRDAVEEAANLLSRLNLASEGKVAMNELEWTGKYNEANRTVKVVELDSDDEEDPLKILAQVSALLRVIFC